MLKNYSRSARSCSIINPDVDFHRCSRRQAARKARPTFDFVIFPAGWMVGRSTRFGPPGITATSWSEFMGLIKRPSTGRKGRGFRAGGMSLQHMMLPQRARHNGLREGLRMPTSSRSSWRRDGLHGSRNALSTQLFEGICGQSGDAAGKLCRLLGRARPQVRTAEPGVLSSNFPLPLTLPPWCVRGGGEQCHELAARRPKPLLIGQQEYPTGRNQP